MARVICILSGKGGVGKTTVALNLGTVLAQYYKKSVTLVDCNLTTSHLGLYLGMYYCPLTLNKVLKGEADIEDAMYDHFSGMKIIPSSLSVNDLGDVDIALLKDKIANIGDKNDIIFLDAGPGLGREVLAALKACDEAIFVTTPYVPSVMDIIKCQELINEIGIKPLGIVLNMVNREKYEMTIGEIEQLTRLPVIASIPYDKNVNKSMASKIPVITLNPKTNASRELFRLGATLIGEVPREESLFSRILQRIRRPKPGLPLPQDLSKKH